MKYIADSHTPNLRASAALQVTESWWRSAKSRGAVVLVLLSIAGLLATGTAFADFDATLFDVYLWSQAEAGDVLRQDLQDYRAIQPGNYTYDASANQSGSTASGNIEVGVVVQALPEQATITFKADGETAVPPGVPSSEFAGAYTDGGFFVSFSVPELACVRVTAQGTMSTTGGHARFSYDVGPDILVATGQSTSSASESVNINTKTAVPSGVLHIGIEFIANAYSDPDEPLLEGTVTIDLTITVKVLDENCVEEDPEDLEDCEAEIYFWEGLSGAYNVASNWEPACVPGDNHIAVFDKDQTYTVQFGTEKSARVLIDRGIVSFSQGNYTLEAGSVTSPSLVVGNDSTDFSILELVNGHKLTIGFGALGENSGHDSWVLASSGAVLEATEQLVVGGAGKAAASVHGSGRMGMLQLLLGTETGGHGNFGAYDSGDGDIAAFISAMAAGVNGVGEVNVFGHRVYAIRATLGVNDGAEGMLTVRAYSDSGYGHFEFEELTVGDGGRGTVKVEQGGKLLSLIQNSSGFDSGFSSWARLGQKHSGFGEVLITDCGSLLDVEFLTIALEGGAKLIVADGSRVKTALMGIAEGPTGQGQVLVNGACEDGMPSILEVTGGIWNGNLAVGFLGNGLLEIANGGLVTCGNADVGGQGGGTGLVLVEGAESIWRIDDSLHLGAPALGNEDMQAVGNIFIQDGMVSTKTVIIHPGSGIHGNGTLQFEVGPENVIEGTVSAGLFLAPLLPAKQDLATVTRAAGHGTLTIRGGLPMNSGMLEVSMSGTEPGQYDQIVVDGDVNLDGTTIRLVFTNENAPRANDTLPFLTATGTISISDALLEYTGLEEGFDYRINIQSGALMFEALNDGVPQSDEEDEDECWKIPPGCHKTGASGGFRWGDVLTLCLLLPILTVGTRSQHICRTTASAYRSASSL